MRKTNLITGGLSLIERVVTKPKGNKNLLIIKYNNFRKKNFK